jgi:4-amino-4-deoxy-L-arabinose transferase-like glycosyltransferase
MSSARHFRIPSPLPLSLLLLLGACYLLPGLVDHDPLKTDDAVSFGIVFEALQGNWLTPTLAGEPYPSASPLYFWLAAIFAKLFSGLFSLHGAARLASGACAGIAVFCIALTAREMFGAAVAGSAALILIGNLGLLLYAHLMSAEIALLAALAVALLGIALAARRPSLAGLITGCGIGAAFLAHGLAPALAALLLAAVFTLGVAQWRQRAARFWLVLVAASAPWFLLWPLALYFQAPQQFYDWWSAANLAQLPWSRDGDANPLAQAGGYLKLMGWFAWPALPLALWTLWRNRRRLAQPGIVLGLVAFLLFLAELSWGTDAHDITALPLLLPLTLLGAAAVGDLRRGAANALDWFGMMTFSLIGLAVWILYIALQTGNLAALAERSSLIAQLLEPGFVARVSAPAIAFALLFSAAWIVLITRGERSSYRGVANWAAGVTLFWGLAVALLVPLIDYGKSYRGMAEALKAQLPGGEDACVSSRHLGEPQRASLHYFAGLVTLRDEVTNADCGLMLVQGSAADDSGNPGAGWTLVWQGNRAGDKNERYRLYRRLNEIPVRSR